MAIRISQIEDARNVLKTIQRFHKIHGLPIDVATLEARLDIVVTILNNEIARARVAAQRP